MFKGLKNIKVLGISLTEASKDNFSVTPVKGKKQQEHDPHRLWRIYLNAAMVEKASLTIHVLPPANL